MVRSYISCIIFFVHDQYVFCDFICRKYWSRWLIVSILQY
jgi:hypothetical protein